MHIKYYIVSFKFYTKTVPVILIPNSFYLLQNTVAAKLIENENCTRRRNVINIYNKYANNLNIQL